MSNFYQRTEKFIIHTDGFRYRICSEDDGMVQVEYQEYDTELKRYVAKQTLSFMADVAGRLTDAICEIAKEAEDWDG